MAVRSRGSDTLVEGIVFVLPNGDMRFLQITQVLMLAGVVTYTVVKPLQLARGVLCQQVAVAVAVAVAVVGEGLGLPFLAFPVPGITGDQATEWVVLERSDPVASYATGRLVAAVVVEVVGDLFVEAGFLA